MTGVRRIRRITDHPFLNYYEMEAEGRDGTVFPYYMASRARREQDLYMKNPEKAPDGVMIYALYGEARDRVVLVRQYRYPAGTRVYEFPAGQVEPGEDYRESAVREMCEETGLTLTLLHPAPFYERAHFTTDGMTDERCAVVYGTAAGEISSALLEGTEDLEVILADRREVQRILREEPVALMCAYMLMHFLKDEKHPFPWPAGEEENSIDL